MGDITVETGSWSDFEEAASEIRMTVFVEEQGVAASEELDGKDPDAVQFLARDGDDPVGTARLRFPEPEVGKAERVAVRESARGAGVGAALMRAVEEAARENEAESVVLHAQTRVEGFYRNLGYETDGSEFEEAGIPHVEMRKPLDG
ncbi:GNAT family N-acetyltransferase [Haloarcula salina]|uniref:GNAT family N-acetyltransferase n=1 Tax=Haloarcula salina TaxID=1429914 RepID=A0AA41G2K2_9EURY|nr:GNAT family N-acetyltransferase [Haloarcula salina]MBV0903185.1 GNAT family N-acetyltransferase [Haloarcula salina]